MILITKSTSKLKLKIGTQAYYEATIHGSVGKKESLEIDNDEVIRVTKKTTEYVNKLREQRPGSDKAIRTFVIDAISAGEAKITIEKKFRGRVENIYVVSCIVSE